MRQSLTFLQFFKRIILIILVWCLLGFFQLIIKIVPFKIYSNWLNKSIWYSNKLKLSYELGYACLIGKMVTLVSRYTPWPSKCLVQAITTKYLLRLFKITNTLIIGVAFETDGKFIAHAWVDVAGTIVVGGINSDSKFKAIKIFSDKYNIKN